MADDAYKDQFENAPAPKEPPETPSPLPPLEVQATERVKELLVKELPRIYGIPKKDSAKTITAIIDTLSARAIMDPWNLHSHIKDSIDRKHWRLDTLIVQSCIEDIQEGEKNEIY